MFESSVNSEGIETNNPMESDLHTFESSVNSEGIETLKGVKVPATSLRAV